MPGESRTHLHGEDALVGIVENDGSSGPPRQMIDLLFQALTHVALGQLLQSLNVNLCCQTMSDDRVCLSQDISMDLARLLRSKNERNTGLASFPQNGDQ